MLPYNQQLLFAVSFVLVMSMGYVSLGFAEPLKLQLDHGIEIDDIQCNNEKHVLVIRTNGNFACVTENTAEKMNWQKIQFHDLSGILLKSDKEDGEFVLGQFTDRFSNTGRTPAIVPYSLLSTVIESPSGKISTDSIQSGEITQNSDDLSNLAPTYIPDGQELKFIATQEYSYLGEETEQINFVYAPIASSVNPQNATYAQIYDLGGIQFTITTTSDLFYANESYDDSWKNTTNGEIIKDDFYKIYLLNGTSEAIIAINYEDTYQINITSFSYGADELLKMAEHFIGNVS